MQRYQQVDPAARRQLRLAIGDAAFDAIPDRQPKASSEPRPRRQQHPRREARQRIILGGFTPAIVAAGFTQAEVAVLCVLAAEHQRHGCCTLTVGEIAYRAQCCRTVVQNCLHWAARRGLIRIDRRRVAANRNLPNIVTLVSRVWLAWLRLGPARPRPWGHGGFMKMSGNPLQRSKRPSAKEPGRPIGPFSPSAFEGSPPIR